MLSAAEITGRSFQLYKQNWKPMLVSGFIVTVLNALIDIQWAAISGEMLASLISLILSFLTAPVLLLGYHNFLAQVWRKEVASMSDILRFCRSVSVYGKSLWFYFVYSLCSFMILLFAGLVVSILLLPMNMVSSVFAALLLFPLILLAAWPLMRIWLAEYLYMFRASDSATDVVFDAFGMMKGYVWKYILVFLMSILIGLPMIILELLAAHATIPLDMVSFVTSTGFICEALLSPMIYLMLAGFACEVLREHGVIDNADARLIGTGSVASVFACEDVQEAVIAEKKEDIYYD